MFTLRYVVKKNEWKKVSSPTMPPPRSSHQVVTVPTDGGQLFLFGGELGDKCGPSAHDRHAWTATCVAFWRAGVRRLACGGRRVRLDDSGHPGGEFSSPSQQKFHHFRDFWMLDLATWSWEQAH